MKIINQNLYWFTYIEIFIRKIKRDYINMCIYGFSIYAKKRGKELNYCIYLVNIIP